MKHPQMNNINNTKTTPLLFKGLNRNVIIGDDELADGFNLDTKNLPAITPRLPMSVLGTLTAPTQYGVVDGNHYYVNANKFYYGGVEKLTLTGGRKSIVDFNGNLVIFPDKKFYNWQDDTSGTFISPDVDYAVVHYNRIFGIKDNYVNASKVGDFTIWDEFNGTEMDSWSADVYSDGIFTAIASYQDHVIFFKKNLMYELYGYTPSQFKIMESSKIGCISQDSIAEVRGVLYFANEDGIQTYSGGFPRNMSERLNIKNLNNAVGVSANGNYYVAMDDVTYIYDMPKDTWLPYINKGAIDFAVDGTDVVMLGKDKNVYVLEDGTEPVIWSATTKNFDGGMFNKKYPKSIKLRAKLEKGTEIKIYICYNESENFELVKHIRHTDKYHIDSRDIRTILHLKRCSNYQLKIEGKGKVVVYGEIDMLIGSDI